MLFFAHSVVYDAVYRILF